LQKNSQRNAVEIDMSVREFTAAPAAQDLGTEIDRRTGYDGFAAGKPEPVLSKSVLSSVESYFATMDDQPVTDLYELVLCQVEQPLLVCVLRQTNNNQSQTAQILGLNRGTLRKKLKKYGLL
jgi:Fis family transcriptional regulator, factor for inversion stimulation protein